MSFDFDELKHKAGNMLEKGKEKAHEAAESEKGQKIKSKAGCRKQNFRAGCSQCGNYSTGLAKRQEGFVLRQRRQCRRQSAFSG